MTICIVATASAYRGALIIYKQFLEALAKNAEGDEWHIFIDYDMPMPAISNVHYHICHTKGLGRIWFDLFGFKKYCKSSGIQPEVVVTLQNTGVNGLAKRTVIYYHQSLPLYHYKFSLFDKAVKENLFYNYIYPLYVKLYLNSKAYVAVQTETIKQLFVERYKFPGDRVGVYYPNMKHIDSDSVVPYTFELNTYNFLYPSMGASYKEHITLAYALKKIISSSPEIAKRIRIHLTVTEADMSTLVQFSKENGLADNFLYHGNLPHDQILSMLKSCNALLFPSVVETLGLPLIEAASLGTPIIANNMGYVHDALNDYEGTGLVKVHDYDDWARQITRCCMSRGKYSPHVVIKNDSWDRLFRLIKEGVVV